MLYFCLAKENLCENIPLLAKEESVVKEEKITKQLYADYSLFKREVFRDIVKKNMDNPSLRELTDKDIKKTLFKKTQKLLDRFLFIFFAEDKQLIPANSITKINDKWQDDVDFGEDKKLYDLYKQYFHVLDIGRPKSGKRQEIFAYNGGLFEKDPILEALLIDDALLKKHTAVLTAYDFDTDVDVNILGHIFENSLNEIESINAEIEGVEFDKQKTKRKKDGVFYTPKYITKYIVDNTVGKLCEEKKQELDINDEVYLFAKQRSRKRIDNLEEYRKWLLQLTICDPACGSGAFLNQALDFLIKEHAYIDELTAKYNNEPMLLSDIENSILEHNIYGVDINDESVDIAKLSLWLRTAQKGRKLTSLNTNIKCGNSLIDDPKVAGDKAFDWQHEFPEIFTEKKKKAWHITTATHNSRYSQRMFDNHVKLGEAVWIDEEGEIIITKTIAEIIIEDKLNVIEYNICGDHMHLLLVCEEEELTMIMGKIKAVSGRRYNIEKGITVVPATSITRGHVPLSDTDADTEEKKEKKKYNSLWTQKFGKSEIKDEDYLNNAIEYIRNNRIKHELPKSKEIEKLKKEFLSSVEYAFRKEYNGGFDVVIGNPPYLRVQGLRENFEKESKHYETNFKSATGRFDVYVLFMEKSFELIKPKGEVSFILPHKFLVSDFGVGIRQFFIDNKSVNSIVHFGSEMVFDDASVYTCIINLSNNNENIKFKNINPSEIFNNILFEEANYNSLTEEKWNLKSEILENLFKKLKSQPLTVKDVFENISQGVVSVGDDVFLLKGKIQGDKFIGYSDKIKKEIILEADAVKPLLKGEDVKKYAPLNNKYFCLYPHYEEKGKTIPFEEEFFKNTYPLSYEYILPFKEELIEKKIRYKTNPKAWYSLHRSREISLFEQEKIVTPETSLGGNMTMDYDNYFHNTQVYSLIKNKNIKEEYKFWLSILNSSLFWFYLQQTGAVLRGGYFRFKTKYLEPFPLPKLEVIEQQNAFIEKVDAVLINTKSFTSVKDKFTRYFQSQFSIEKPSKKLQNWQELEFANFIIELNKAIKKVGGEKLTKTDEMEWMEVFETKKTEAQAIKTEIDKTDKEIDQMVYALYGLTEEEITIVEGGV